MSGPKYSKFQLEEMQKRRLAKERERMIEEERRRKEEERQVAKEVQKMQAGLKSVKQQIQQSAKNEREKLKQAALPSIADEFTTEVNKLFEKMGQFPATYDRKNKENMQRYMKEIAEFSRAMRQEAERLFQKYEQRATNAIADQSLFEERQSFLEQVGTIKVEGKQSFKIPTHHEDGEMEDHEASLEEVMEKVEAELEDFLAYSDYERMREVKQIHESILSLRDHRAFDAAYKVSQIEKRLKAFYAQKRTFDQSLTAIRQAETEFESLYVHYQSLCNLVGAPEDVTYEQAGTKDIHKLRQEIDELNKQYEEQQETEFIVQSVHEVMEELGYDILATDFMKRKTQNVHHQLYEFGEQAVNVFVSDQGSVLFEVSGVSEGPKEMTSLEKLKVKEAMEEFCSGYDDIKESLKKKGIYLTNESLQPPAEQYARNMDISGKKIIKKKEQRSQSKSATPKHRTL